MMTGNREQFRVTFWIATEREGKRGLSKQQKKYTQCKMQKEMEWNERNAESVSRTPKRCHPSPQSSQRLYRHHVDFSGAFVHHFNLPYWAVKRVCSTKRKLAICLYVLQFYYEVQNVVKIDVCSSIVHTLQTTQKQFKSQTPKWLCFKLANLMMSSEMEMKIPAAAGRKKTLLLSENLDASNSFHLNCLKYVFFDAMDLFFVHL